MVGYEVDGPGAARIISCALELLVEVEHADEALLPDAVIAERQRLRAAVDEHLDFARPTDEGHDRSNA